MTLKVTDIGKTWYFLFIYLTLLAYKFSLKSVVVLSTAVLIWIVGQFEPVVKKLLDQVQGLGIIYFKTLVRFGKLVWFKFKF